MSRRPIADRYFATKKRNEVRSQLQHLLTERPAQGQPAKAIARAG